MTELRSSEKIQTNKIVVANQLDSMVVNKEKKRAKVVYVTIPSDSNNRKKEHRSLRNIKG